MRLDAFKNDGQADACTCDLAALFAATLEEGLENTRAFLVGYARSRVPEFEYKTRWRLARANGDESTLWRELDRIRQQIINNRADFVAIRVHNYVFDFELQLNMGGFQRQSLRLGDEYDELAQGEIRQRQHLALGLPRREAQQVLDELLQLQPVHAQNVRDFALRLLEVADRSVEQQFRALADVGEWRLYLRTRYSGFPGDQEARAAQVTGTAVVNR